ncbi:probable cytochrome P450 6a20 [Phymastichus coffea]|uniref:probable cytochrome P450 6a20 n=1 Tax=Phymastichus coffea TaxID=108790 RepID=UPI00273B9632|nr:probable cytochrome P450 6a20 [Phymastichus coffea]
MERLSIEILLAIVIVLVYIYFNLTRNFNYWKKRQVPGPKPTILFGTFKNVKLGRIHLADYFKSIYDTYPNEPAVGLFAGDTPMLLVKDFEMMKDVLIKNFSRFTNRGFTVHEDIDPLGKNLVLLNYDTWKPMRKNLTPAFSRGKLKEMFYLINECTDNFAKYLESLAMKDDPVECRDLTAKFTTDVIGVCAFGLNTNSMSDDKSEFRKVGQDFLANSWTNTIRIGIRSLPYWMALILKPIARNEKMIKFFTNILTDTMEYRKKNGIRRNDFVDLLMDIKGRSDNAGEEEMTDLVLTAQAFVFFIAGFETSSTTMSNAMYELALNTEIQDKLRQEIIMTFDKNNGQLNYDLVKDMKYLDKVFKETVRKYPVIFWITREATSDHTFSDHKISITKGTRISIPIHAIHHDPSIYPDPDKFDPERFDEKVIDSRPNFSYLPFGDGPRNCIGERFAYNQTKLGLAIAIKNFKFQICGKTCKVYKKRFDNILLAPQDGLYLNIKKV